MLTWRKVSYFHRKLKCKIATHGELMFFRGLLQTVWTGRRTQREKVWILLNEGQRRQETCSGKNGVSLPHSLRRAGRQCVKAAEYQYRWQCRVYCAVYSSPQYSSPHQGYLHSSREKKSLCDMIRCNLSWGHFQRQCLLWRRVKNICEVLWTFAVNLRKWRTLLKLWHRGAFLCISNEVQENW